MDVSKGAAAQPSQSSNPELIAIEIKRLENALRHLERSQVELEEALVDEGEGEWGHTHTYTTMTMI